jgi:hypothetical protein
MALRMLSRRLRRSTTHAAVLSVEFTAALHVWLSHVFSLSRYDRARLVSPFSRTMV